MPQECITVCPEFGERDPPKMYPGYSGMYPYHPFSMGFTINQPAYRGPSPAPVLPLQTSFRHFSGNHGAGSVPATIPVSIVFSIWFNTPHISTTPTDVFCSSLLV